MMAALRSLLLLLAARLAGGLRPSVELPVSVDGSSFVVEVGAELLGDDTSNLVESVARLFIKGRRKERERVDESQYGVTLESFVNSIQNKRWRKKNVPQRR